MLGKEKIINGYQLEICANSTYSALQAQLGGASRVELCQSLELGGTTPSYGQIRQSRAALSIGIHVLIRPRAGDFFYSAMEFEEMKEDIRFCKDAGCDGVVLGLLNKDGSIDKARNAALVEIARPMKVVFHRAFDRCKDPFTSLEELVALGFDRILTSGLQLTAIAGKDLLKKLIDQAAGRIEIMPGAGVSDSHLLDLLSYTGARSVHSSAKINCLSQMSYNELPMMGMNEDVSETSREKVEALVALLERI